MYHDIVLIDALTPDGILTNFKIVPKNNTSVVMINKIHDIIPQKQKNVSDIGGTRIYNSNECSITQAEAHIRDFQVVDNQFSFQFDHIGIPVGRIENMQGGTYNLILASGYRFTDFHIVDPYDHNHEEIHDKREFLYNVVWDKECNVQLVEMDLRSRHGSFSFIAYGTFIPIGLPGDHVFVKANESKWKISALTSDSLLKARDQKSLLEEIEKKVDWLEMKPNICGMGLNLNIILKDSIKYIKNRKK